MAIFRLPVNLFAHWVARFQSREKLEQNQLRRFRRLLQYIIPRSPYYRAIVKERGIEIRACRPEDFPELAKDEVVDHLDDLLTVRDVNKKKIQEFLVRSKDPHELLQNRYFCLNTSGSSGTIGYCLYDPRDWYCGIAPALLYEPSPSIRPLRAAFVGAVQGHFAGVSIAAVADRLPLSLYFKVCFLDVHDALSKNVEKLNRFQPDLITGYPSALLDLSQEQRAGRLKVRPRMVQNSGGNLLQQDRRFVSESFNVPVVNYYACSEHLFLGASDGTGPGMLLFEDFIYFEPLSDRTLITNLYNRTLPLIRYRMDDQLEVLESNHPGPHRFVSEIIGRREQAPVFVNRDGREDQISPIVISTLFVESLRRFQVRVHDRERFSLWAELERGLETGQRERAVADMKAFWDDLLHQKRMENVRYEVRLTDRLAPDPRTGKLQMVVIDAERKSSAADP